MSTSDNAPDKTLRDTWFCGKARELPAQGKWAGLGYECLYQGDFDSALEHFRRGAAEDDAESCFGIVELYENAKPKDPAEHEKAVREEEEMLQKAARLGHGKAIVRLSW